MSTSAPLRHIPPLRGVRQGLGISVRELSRRTGLDATFLSRVERGEEHLSTRSLEKVARALGLRDLARLIGPWVRQDDD